jgi:mono/diheme cytochrome c family protein
MKFVKTGLVILFVGLFIFACKQTANNNVAANSNVVSNTVNITKSTPIDELAAAKTTYTESCQKCHKPDGAGGIIEFGGNRHKAANLKSEGMKKESDEDLFSEIQEGVPEEGMPAFKGKLTDDQIINLVKFIRKEFQGK